VVADVAARLPGSPRVVVLGDPVPGLDAVAWADWLVADAPPLAPIQLPFDHPLAVLYSSGTTGLPKALVHRAGGVLLKHHTELHLHGDIGPGDRLLYFTTCGWMMWNWLVSALAEGAAIVLFDGSPSHPTLDVLWEAVDRLDVTHFGTSARFIHGCRAAGLVPSTGRRFQHLRTVFSTGSPLARTGFEWIYRDVKADVHLASISGGTDIVGCFMVGVPTEPVYAGEIQAPALGVDLAAFDDDGRPVVGRPGELVCRQPLPSMPLGFWGDADGSRYRAAYFERFPGVWRHGDLIEITEHRGIVVYGRSDATLNPGGVRIGTAEILPAPRNHAGDRRGPRRRQARGRRRRDLAVRRAEGRADARRRAHGAHPAHDPHRGEPAPRAEAHPAGERAAAHAQRQVDGDRRHAARERTAGAQPDGRGQPGVARRDRSGRRPPVTAASTARTDTGRTPSGTGRGATRAAG
jgi:acyl-coenzyme A synthetase/AMP-(fatty) acid ligase